MARLAILFVTLGAWSTAQAQAQSDLAALVFWPQPRSVAVLNIDASVEITRFGFVKSANVIAKSPGTSRAIEKDFRRCVHSTRFRPRFVNGELARSDRFKARFYFDY